jgi:hypothetical protein
VIVVRNLFLMMNSLTFMYFPVPTPSIKNVSLLSFRNIQNSNYNFLPSKIWRGRSRYLMKIRGIRRPILINLLITLIYLVFLYLIKILTKSRKITHKISRNLSLSKYISIKLNFIIIFYTIIIFIAN